MGVYGEDEFLCFMYYDEFASPWHDARRYYYNIWAYPAIKLNGCRDENQRRRRAAGGRGGIRRTLQHGKEAEYLAFHFFGDTTRGVNVTVGHFGDEVD